MSFHSLGRCFHRVHIPPQILTVGGGTREWRFFLAGAWPPIPAKAVVAVFSFAEVHEGHRHMIRRGEVPPRPPARSPYQRVRYKVKTGKATSQHSVRALFSGLKRTVFGTTSCWNDLVFSNAHEIVREIEIDDLVAVYVNSHDEQ